MTSNGKPRGGNHGGGTTVRTVVLSEAAAAYVKRKATICGTRYRKEEANATASAILEAQDRMLYITDDMIAALPALEVTRQQSRGDAERGIAQLIAALWVARDA